MDVSSLPTTPESIRRLAELGQNFTQILGIVTGVSVTFGWLLAASFYDKFDVRPEEVGVTFSTLVASTLPIGIVGLVLGLGIRKLLRLASDVRSTTVSIRGWVKVVVSTPVMFVVVAATASMCYMSWPALDAASPASALIAFAVCGTATALTMVLFCNAPFVIQLRVAAAALLIILIACVIVYPLWWGDKMADDAKAGDPVTFEVMPGIPIIQVVEVRPISADPTKPLPVTGCVLRFGAANGTSLLLTDGIVWRVADQNIIVSSRC